MKKLFGVVPGQILLVCVLGVGFVAYRHHVRSTAEAAIHRQIQDNFEGVQELRKALTSESENISGLAALLQAQSSGHAEAPSPLHLGLAVMAFTDANWRAANSTGAVQAMEYDSVTHFAGAYFEQARLAQLQVATLESMMQLQSYVGQGTSLASLTPEQA